MSYSYVVIPYNVVCKSVKMIRVDFHESSLFTTTVNRVVSKSRNRDRYCNNNCNCGHLRRKRNVTKPNDYYCNTIYLFLFASSDVGLYCKFVLSRKIDDSSSSVPHSIIYHKFNFLFEAIQKGLTWLV